MKSPAAGSPKLPETTRTCRSKLQLKPKTRNRTSLLLQTIFKKIRLPCSNVLGFTLDVYLYLHPISTFNLYIQYLHIPYEFLNVLNRDGPCFGVLGSPSHPFRTLGGGLGHGGLMQYVTLWLQGLIFYAYSLGGYTLQPRGKNH